MENLKEELIENLKVYFDTETSNQTKKVQSGLLVQLKSGDVIKIFVKKVDRRSALKSQNCEVSKGMQNNYDFTKNKLELKDLKELSLYLNEIVNLEYDVDLNGVITVASQKFKICIL